MLSVAQNLLYVSGKDHADGFIVFGLLAVFLCAAAAFGLRDRARRIAEGAPPGKTLPRVGNILCGVSIGCIFAASVVSFTLSELTYVFAIAGIIAGAVGFLCAICTNRQRKQLLSKPLLIFAGVLITLTLIQLGKGALLLYLFYTLVRHASATVQRSARYRSTRRRYFWNHRSIYEQRNRMKRSHFITSG